MAMAKKRAHIIYSGSVQGVGFRWTAQHAANSANITGWVRNCPDSTVEVVSEGEEKNVKAFLAKIKNAMEPYIRSMNVKWQKPTGEFDSFDIRFF